MMGGASDESAAKQPGSAPAPTPLIAIPLRDGASLSVATDGIRIAERLYPLASIQDARQVAPNPETVALRVAGVGLVEFQPTQVGDGARALDALFRLRSDLRPAGFTSAPPSDAAPAQPISAYPYAPPPYPVYAPPPGYPLPYGYVPVPPAPPRAPIAPVPPPPEVAAAYGVAPNRRRPELTPFPKSLGQLVASVYSLYIKRLGPWLWLAALIVLLPELLQGALQVAIGLLQGTNPLAPLPNPLDAFQQALNGATPPPASASANPALAALASLLSLALIFISLLVSAWQLATLTYAAREQLFNRRLRPGASLRSGAARLFPTLGYMLLVGLIQAAVAIIFGFIAIFLAVVVGVLVGGPNAASTTGAPTLTTATLIALAVAALLTAIPIIYFSVRLALTPYAAALNLPGPFANSWRLTQRHWWRSALALALTGLPAIILSLGVALLPYLFSWGLTLIIISPVVIWLTNPLSVIAHTALLYDLRLRREGYIVFLQEGSPPMPDGSGAQGAIPTPPQQATSPLG